MTLIDAIHDAGLTDAFVLIGALFVVCAWLLCVWILIAEGWRCVAAWRK